jgi:hypothetical protein
MTIRSLVAVALAVFTAGCRSGSPESTPDTQTFTRTIDATRTKVVEAAMAIFSERSITVATSDQTMGEVFSMPLVPNGQWGGVSPEERVNCAGVDAPDPNARMVLKLRVRSEGGRSVMSLEAERSGGASCVMRGSFLTQLLDAISTRATQGM